MKLITTKEVGKRLNRTPQRVVQLIGEGQLKAIKIGGVFLIDPVDLIGFKLRKPTGRPPLNATTQRTSENSTN